MNGRAFRNRPEAGKALALRLAAYQHREDVLVLALPRGGVPVAKEIAEGLGAPLDLLLVRKLGVPGQEELAMGAVAMIAGQQSIVMNERIIHALGLTEDVIQHEIAHQQEELLRRDRLYRSQERDKMSSPAVQNRCLILVDDGLATGATMKAAIHAVRRLAPTQVVIAVPVAPPDTVAELSGEVDEVVCLLTPTFFGGVGQWYEDFSQVSDEEVCHMLQGSAYGQSSRSSLGSN